MRCCCCCWWYPLQWSRASSTSFRLCRAPSDYCRFCLRRPAQAIDICARRRSLPATLLLFFSSFGFLFFCRGWDFEWVSYFSFLYFRTTIYCLLSNKFIWTFELQWGILSAKFFTSFPRLKWRLLTPNSLYRSSLISSGKKRNWKQVSGCHKIHSYRVTRN